MAQRARGAECGATLLVVDGVWRRGRRTRDGDGVSGGGITDVTAAVHDAGTNASLQSDLEAIVNGAAAHIQVSGG